MELLGEDWLDYGDWGIETEAEPPRAAVDAEKAPSDLIADLEQGPAASG